MTVTYEWDCETVTAVESADFEEGEVIEHYHAPKFKEVLKESKTAPPEGCKFALVLVRDDDIGRSWAYLDNGVLPESFEDAYGRFAAKVPRRFHEEVAKSFAAA